MDRELALKMLSRKNGYLNSVLSRKLKNNSNLSNDELELLNYINNNYFKCKSIKEVFYWLKHDLHDIPHCIVCNKEIKFDLTTSSYSKYCCCKCAQLDPNLRIRLENTCIERFGARHNMLVQKYKDQIKKTCLEKYGVENVFSTTECKEKIKQTNIRKYGYDNPRKNKDIIEKTKQTCLKKYGVTCTTKLRSIRLKQQNKYFYNNLYFDSTLEIAYYIYLKDHNINFEYNPQIEFTYKCHNNVHKYFPDFKVEDVYVEIKGNQFFRSDGTMFCPYRYKYWSDEDYKKMCDVYEAKHQCMIKNNVQILLESNMNNIKEYIKEKYGSYNYLKNFKNKKERI